MLNCFNKKDCSLRDILEILCNNKKFECKEGSFGIIKSFVKKKKPKSIILLIKGNVSEKKAKEYAFILSEISKTRQLIWAVNKDKRLGFKVFAAL